MILESVENGPLIWPTVEDNGVIRTKKYAELSAAEKIQADCDMKATNIILQGLPTDIYSLIERECKLYDAFDKFTHIKGESLHTYYLRFTQLINDMNIYKMKMEQFQVNTKFLNSLPPEWSKFVTDVKLVKDLHTSNFDQLHAYLEQHELHANEVRIMRERNQDPLAFVANQQMTPPHFNTYQSSYNNPQLQQQFSPSQHGSIQPNQHYSSHYPSQTQFNHSSIPPSHTFQSQMNHQTSTVPQVIPQVAYQSPQAPTQLMTESPFVDSEFLLPIISSELPLIQETKPLFKMVWLPCNKFRGDKGKIILVQHIRAMLLVQGEIQQVDKLELLNATTAKKLRKLDKYMDEEQLAFLADPGIPADQVQTIIPHNAAFQTEDLDTEKLALKEQIDSLEQHLSKQIKENESLFKTFIVFKNESKEKEDKYMENEIDLEKKIKELDNIICKVGQSAQIMHMLTKPQEFYDNIHKQALGYQNPFYLRKAQWMKPTLYDGVVLSNTHVVMPVINDEETLILEEESRSKMSEKAKDPEVIAKKISHKPIDYESLNSLTDDFEKCFSP
ncbi:hypothetical protein Tco_0233722 [Tanacetum coccineum]